jgi:D-glycero-D-manno-heptose 1,7-bisphosphate phosphatase
VSPLRKKPAVFLDRDGVIIENRLDYVKSIAEVHFIPGALDALARASRLDWYLVVVTNQSAIGQGLLSWETSVAINDFVVQQLKAAGGRLDGLYVCPHLAGAGCACRKPAPGLLLSAAEDLGIDLAASMMIGDALTDLQAGQAAGTQALLVSTGRGAGQAAGLVQAGLAGVPVLADLAAALEHVAATVLFTDPGQPS